MGLFYDVTSTPNEYFSFNGFYQNHSTWYIQKNLEINNIENVYTWKKKVLRCSNQEIDGRFNTTKYFAGVTEVTTIVLVFFTAAQFVDTIRTLSMLHHRYHCCYYFFAVYMFNQRRPTKISSIKFRISLHQTRTTKPRPNSRDSPDPQQVRALWCPPRAALARACAPPTPPACRTVRDNISDDGLMCACAIYDYTSH